MQGWNRTGTLISEETCTGGTMFEWISSAAGKEVSALRSESGMIYDSPYCQYTVHVMSTNLCDFFFSRMWI